MKTTAKLYRTACICFGIIAFTTITSCRKEGLGGKSSIKGVVMHHDKIIPNAKVYIKYNATEFPGADVSVYDNSTTADANANYQFQNLRKGDYYIYGVGYDNAISEQVVGGISIKLKYNKTTNTNVAVTE